jgi:hypothetical protein
MTSFTVPPQPVAAPYPGGPPMPPPYGGPPPVPPAILRVRLLLLALSVFTAVAVALVLYASQVEIADSPGTESSLAITVVAEVTLFFIVATPLSLAPMTMSILIGRGRNWARVTSVVVLFMQAVFCSCLGAFIPFLPASGPDSTGEKAVVGDAVLGVLGVLIGVASLFAAILLLRKESAAYFRAMSEWRRTRRP